MASSICWTLRKICLEKVRFFKFTGISLEETITLMKRTDFEKRERELKRVHKRVVKGELRNEKALDKDKMSVSHAINTLSELFQYDKEEIYNIQHSEDIHSFVFEMQESFEKKQLENVFRKAIKKTGVQDKQEAFEALQNLLV